MELKEQETLKGPLSAFESPTFGQDGSFRLDKPVGAASISPCGRDIVLASRQGLHIIDLDSPWSPPRFLAYGAPWEVADVQWSPFAARDYWIVSTSNQKALVWNLNLPNPHDSVEHVLHAHSRAISDINFSAHHPDILATCAVDSFIHCWDLRSPEKPALSFSDWFAGATQVKWNRQNPHILASSHDRCLRIWDDRHGARPLKSLEAHTTKIYGIDWNRLDTKSVVTCSLDRTIKFWNYVKDSDEPERTILAPYPVWRARHTPFGHGILAMPQHGDNSLHLYDSRPLQATSESESVAPVHSFFGHTGPVKEFLWRTRGTVTETEDNRDFQLVSWGSDRFLRLHQITADVFDDVGYKMGMEVKRTVRFTRRGAHYRTFRDGPAVEDTVLPQSQHADYINPNQHMTLGVAQDRLVPITLGGHHHESHKTSGRARVGQMSKEVDPITWMRGVKIGKRSNLPQDLHESVSTILSPGLRTEPGWEVFESLGEEISHLGERFPKIVFHAINIPHRTFSISLSGPWGLHESSIRIRVSFHFPHSYPQAALPNLEIEPNNEMTGGTHERLLQDTTAVASAFLSSHRSSAESLIRYLIGEQNLDDCLRSSQKHRTSQDLTLAQDQDSSSSDDEDILKTGLPFQSAGDQAATSNQISYGVPLPKACGAVWAKNGLLVCFFPTKSKDTPLLDHGMGSNKRDMKTRYNISEGFGKLHNVWRGKRGTKTSSETVADDNSDDGFSTSSSESSASSEAVASQQYFLPVLGWGGEGLDPWTKPSLDESQRSSGDPPAGNSVTSKSSMTIALHDLKDLIPAKKTLALDYSIDRGAGAAKHNAQVARDHGLTEMSDVWTLLELTLKDDVRLKPLQPSTTEDSVMLLVKRALSPLLKADSAIDLSFDHDAEKEGEVSSKIQWGVHPFGNHWLVERLFQHFEQLHDVQTLAMISCVLSEAWDRNVEGTAPVKDYAWSDRARAKPYFLNPETASVLLMSSSHVSIDSLTSDAQSRGSSAFTSVNDQPILSGSQSSTPPATYQAFTQGSDPSSTQLPDSSTVMPLQRQANQSTLNFGGLAAPFSRPFSRTNSAASSPPSRLLRHRQSPSGSHPSGMKVDQALVQDGSPRSLRTPPGGDGRSFSFSSPETAGLGGAGRWKPRRLGTKLKNPDKFISEDSAAVVIDSRRVDRRCYNYRQAYARLLDAWDLPIARCELLKFNKVTQSSVTNIPFASELRTQSAINQSSLDGRTASGLDFYHKCSRCGLGIERSVDNSLNRCYQCRREPRRPRCALCQRYIQGLSSPCLRCSHELHASCRESLLEWSYSSSTHHDESVFECPTGCGCLCSEDQITDVPVLSSSNPHDPLKSTHGRFDAALQGVIPEKVPRDISPAITIIDTADSRGDDHHHQLSWSPRREAASAVDIIDFGQGRRRSDLSTTASLSAAGSYPRSGSPLAAGLPLSINSTTTDSPPTAAEIGGDLAYESLARNLRSGSGSGGSGGGGGSGSGGGVGAGGAVAARRIGAGLRERGSQIWRGG